MRVAIVHDWLTGMRGGERVLEGMLDVFPDADIFTLFHRRGSVSARIEARPIRTSFLQPFAGERYRRLLPLFPLAVERLRPRGYDLVLSSSHCVAKGVRVEDAPHICYCHTPMRYAWGELDAYLTGSRALLRLPAAPLAGALRRWDASTAGRVDAFLANSANVRQRIRRCYGRVATVVHPPVDIARFGARRQPEDFYLVLGALVPYKRVELAVAACARLRRRLVVAGDGPELARLRRLARDVAFLGRVSDDEATQLLARCRALLFPGADDFGITPVEAHAAGAPVIARAAGGALETVSGPHVTRDGFVRPGPFPATGVFFETPDTDSLAAAIRHFERLRFDEAALRASAAPFGVQHFRVRLRREVDRLLGLDAPVRVPVPAAAAG
jgi:glycosyltransferase involved in cell wall biosynthesis